MRSPLATTVALLFALNLTPSWGDAISGPGRTTICTISSAGVFYTTYDVVGEEETAEAKTCITAAGPVRVRKSLNEVTISYPSCKALLEDSIDGFHARVGRFTMAVTHQLNEAVVATSDETLRYYHGMGSLTIEGKQGKVTVQKVQEGQIITSPRGRTELVRNLQGYDVKGLPVSAHPYLYRAVVVMLNGVGFCYDLRHLYTEVGEVPMDWDATWTIKLDQDPRCIAPSPAE